MPANRVWWVNQAVAASGNGSEGSPFKTIAEALALIGAGEEGTVIVATVNPHAEAVSVPGGKTLALLGDGDGASLEIQGMPVIQVNSNAKLFAQGLEVSGGTSSVLCFGGSAWLDRMAVVGEAENANLEVAGNGYVSVRNSFLGGKSNDGPALLLTSGQATIVYSTLVTGVDAPAISCAAGGAGSSVRNSLMVSRSNTPEVVGCDSLDVTTSALEMPLGDNLALGEMDIGWFQAFNSEDFHLSPNAPAELATAAVWFDGDGTTDVDGDPRPTGEGTPDYAGADIP